MRKLAFFAMLLLVPALVQAQLKTQTSQPPLRQAIAGPGNSLFGTLLGNNRFSMHHTFSMSFIGGAGGSLMMNSYLNTMMFRLSNPLLLKVNLGVVSFPYSSFGNQDFNRSLNQPRLFGGAELMYRASEHTFFKVGINVQPAYLSPYRSARLNPFDEY